MAKKINSRGQTAIWVILAIILIASFLLFFALDAERLPPIITRPSTELNPELFISQCAEESVEEATDIMLPRGGFISPRNFRTFNETPVEYLCENIGFFEPCVNQHPVLIQEMEREIDNYITPKINECFDELKREIEKRNWEFSSFEQANVEVGLGEDRIFVDIEKQFSITELNQTRNFDRFEIEIINPAYNLAVIANEIASQEAKYCNFEATGFSLIYPRYRVREYALSDPVRVYTITDSKSGKTMMIAIRSCAIPPGV